MQCTFCKFEMAYIHGHAACINNTCPFYGKNQAECCTGETAENLAVPDTDEVVAVAEGDRPKKG